jgi:HEAT repeat protein
MDATMFQRPLALLLGLSVLLAAGCAGSRDQFSFWPQEKKKGPPGVVSPTDQLAMLHELARKSESRTAQQKQQVSALLVSMYGKETDPLLRAEIVRTMRKFPSPEAISVAQGAIKDSDADVRVAACEALGHMGGQDAVIRLSEALRGDVDADVRMAAARALGGTRDPASVAALGTALDDKDPAMQYRAMAALKNVSGKDLGNDVRAWQQYVKGETPQSQAPTSIAERLRHMFW